MASGRQSGARNNNKAPYASDTSRMTEDKTHFEKYSFRGICKTHNPTHLCMYSVVLIFGVMVFLPALSCLPGRAAREEVLVLAADKRSWLLRLYARVVLLGSIPLVAAAPAAASVSAAVAAVVVPPVVLVKPCFHVLLCMCCEVCEFKQAGR